MCIQQRYVTIEDLSAQSDQNPQNTFGIQGAKASLGDEGEVSLE